MEKGKIKLGIPNGSLEAQTVEIFKKAGWRIKTNRRSYYPSIDDDEIECMIIRPQEMAQYVGRGVLDAGITGYDWMMEVGHPKVIDIAEFKYSRATGNPVRWVMAVPKDSNIKTIKDLEGKIIATEAVGMTKKYLADNNVKAAVEFSWGATEVKPPHLADAIVELTETGTSLKANNLEILDTVLESTTRLIVNKDAYADSFKKKKLDNIKLMVQAVLDSRSLVGIMLNVKEENKDAVLKVLPSMKSPTISKLYGNDSWYAINTIIDKSVVRKIIPELTVMGAVDIVEYPLNKIVK